jgi:hypothetical protein
VHNVKQALIRIFPCLAQVFAPTLHDYIGKIIISLINTFQTSINIIKTYVVANFLKFQTSRS